MGEIDLKYCEKCHGITKHSWEVDPDSLEGEPDFYQKCLRCEGIEDFITRVSPNDRKLEDYFR